MSDIVGPRNLTSREEKAYYRAMERYVTPDEENIQIDGNCRFSHADKGVWVQAWVWVPDEES